VNQWELRHLKDKYPTKSVHLYFIHIGIKKMTFNDLSYGSHVSVFVIFKVSFLPSVNSKEAENENCANFVQKKRVAKFSLATL